MARPTTRQNVMWRTTIIGKGGSQETLRTNEKCFSTRNRPTFHMDKTRIGPRVGTKKANMSCGVKRALFKMTEEQPRSIESRTPNFKSQDHRFPSSIPSRAADNAATFLKFTSARVTCPIRITERENGSFNGSFRSVRTELHRCNCHLSKIARQIPQDCFDVLHVRFTCVYKIRRVLIHRTAQVHCVDPP